MKIIFLDIDGCLNSHKFISDCCYKIIIEDEPCDMQQFKNNIIKCDGFIGGNGLSLQNVANAIKILNLP